MWVSNFWFMESPMFIIGIILKQNKAKFELISKKVLLVIMMISFFEVLLVYMFFGTADLYLGFIIFAIALFIVVQK